MWSHDLTKSLAVCLNGHCAVLLFDELVTQQDPSGVVVFVHAHSPLKVNNGHTMVTTQAVEVSQDRTAF